MVEDDVAEYMPNRNSGLSGLQSDVQVVDIEGDETDDEFNTSDIDFNAEYSDDGNTVPIDERTFWEYL